MRSIAVLGGNMHSQITVGNVTLPKAVLSTVKIFAVYIVQCEVIFGMSEFSVLARAIIGCKAR